LIAGALLDEKQVPLTYADCNFGTWYYGSGQCLAQNKTFIELEKPHKSLHSHYMKLFLLLFEKAEPSFLQKIFGSAQKQKEEKLAEAATMLPALKHDSHEMIQLLKMLETEIVTMTEDKFNQLFCYP